MMNGSMVVPCRKKKSKCRNQFQQLDGPSPKNGQPLLSTRHQQTLCEWGVFDSGCNTDGIQTEYRRHSIEEENSMIFVSRRKSIYKKKIYILLTKCYQKETTLLV